MLPLAKRPLWTRSDALEVATDSFVLYDGVKSLFKWLRNNEDTHNVGACVPSVPELTAGPEPKPMVDNTVSTWRFSPMGRRTFPRMLRYQARFVSVSPKMRKNVKPKIGLTNWKNLTLKTVQKPDDFHSFDVIIGMSENPL